MALFRKVVFWLHLIIAVCAGTVILVMSATGVLLTYEKKLTYWNETRLLNGGPPQPGARPLPAAVLLARVQAVRDEAPTALRWRAPANAPLEVVLGRAGTIYVNRYSGAVLGQGDTDTRAFFGRVTELHRYLGAGGENRERGKAITGAANLGFLFLAMSGFYLWWPRNLTRRAFANITRFRRGLSPKARDFNWHNVIGFWSLVPLLVIIVSGAMISYPWINDLMYRVVGDTPPPRAGALAPAAAERAPEPEPAAPAPETWDALLARAQRRHPDWNSVTMQLKPGAAGLASTVERGQGFQIQKRVQLTADPGTLDFVKVETFADHSPGRRARLTLRYLHTGEWFGWAGQTFAGIISAGILVMIWTGISLALRRLWNWRRRRAATS